VLFHQVKKLEIRAMLADQTIEEMEEQLEQAANMAATTNQKVLYAANMAITINQKVQ
jgi:hypothetical protein